MTSVDLPLPGTPVMPTTRARPARVGRARRGASRAPGASSSISVSRRARARAGRRPTRARRRGARATSTSGVHRVRRRPAAGRSRARGAGAPQISPCVRPARGAVDDRAEDVAVAAARRRASSASSAVGDRRARARRLRRARTRRGARCIAPRSGRSTGGRLRGVVVDLVLVDADDDLLAALDALLEAHRRFADHPLHEAGLDRLVHAAGVVDRRHDRDDLLPPSASVSAST